MCEQKGQDRTAGLREMGRVWDEEQFVLHIEANRMDGGWGVM